MAYLPVVVWGGLCMPVHWPNPHRSVAEVPYDTFGTLSAHHRTYAKAYANLSGD